MVNLKSRGNIFIFFFFLLSLSHTTPTVYTGAEGMTRSHLKHRLQPRHQLSDWPSLMISHLPRRQQVSFLYLFLLSPCHPLVHSKHETKVILTLSITSISLDRCESSAHAFSLENGRGVFTMLAIHLTFFSSLSVAYIRSAISNSDTVTRVVCTKACID